jgi:hypothetical protein
MYLVFVVYVILVFLVVISSLLVVISLEIQKIRSMAAATTAAAAAATVVVATTTTDNSPTPSPSIVPGYFTPAPVTVVIPPLAHAVFSTPASLSQAS